MAGAWHFEIRSSLFVGANPPLAHLSTDLPLRPNRYILPDCDQGITQKPSIAGERLGVYQ
jgi:hypothetical protein